ncbi:MAG: SDR family NAD(P)-dependent oxidoreductase [Bacteriovoracia bacterium]
MFDRKDLKGYRALVTGASSGIGEEFARQLAERGADLVITARRTDRLEALAKDLREKCSVEVQVVSVDLCQSDAGEKLFNAVTEGGKFVNVLINNAGIGSYGPFMQRPLQRHLDTIQVDCTALMELTYRFIQHMLTHRKPSFITNVASIAAFQGVANFVTYSGAKGFVRQFSETLNWELQGTNVHITCLCPGGTTTEFFQQSGQKITESGQSTMMLASEVVRIALNGMFSRKAIVIPGLLNKLACFFPRLVPRYFALWLAYKVMNRAVQIEEKSATM